VPKTLLQPVSTMELAAAANTRALRPKHAHTAGAGVRESIGYDKTQQLPTPVPSDFPTHSHQSPSPAQAVGRTHSEDLFAMLDGDGGNAALEELAQAVEKIAATERSRDWKQNMRDVDENEDYGGALFDEHERLLLDKIRLDVSGPKPVVRTAFPASILDRSPIFGASNATSLRVCFRLGEALNTGCQAVRMNKDVVLELYARVTASWAEPVLRRAQHFVIKDLYHDNPPYLNGTFALRGQSILWDEDSAPFMEKCAGGRLCRMIARMKRDGTKWRLEVLNVWQAGWEDVEHVMGIYAKSTEMGD